MLCQWAQHLKWPIKPIRTVGPKGWIVGSEVPPPSLHLHFNSQPILAREVTPRVSQSNPIIAGPKPTKPLESLPPASLPPLRGDPWGGWKGTTNNAAVSQLAHIPVGQTEQKFAQQEERLVKLEESLQSLQKQQVTSNAAVEQLQTDLQQRDIKLEKSMDQRLTILRKELDQSFTSALQAQSSSFNQNMQGIKQLLLTKSKRLREQNEDSEMEG